MDDERGQDRLEVEQGCFARNLIKLPQARAGIAPSFNFNKVQDNGRPIMKLTHAFVLAMAAMMPLSLPASAATRHGDPIKAFDTDNDGTLDLVEVKKVAADLFAKLDGDHEGTLDRRELHGRLTAKELAAADPDHDGTLTMDEYLAVVAQRFDVANGDHDGTLDAKELATPAGRSLLRLLR